MSPYTEEWCKAWRKADLLFQNYMRDLVNFNASSGKSENLHFVVLLLSITYKVSAKKVKRSYLLWHWSKKSKSSPTLKKNWVFVWKMTWKTLWFLTQAVEILKVCTLMDYLCQNYVMFWAKKKYRRPVSWKMTYSFKNDINNFVNFHISIWK